MAELFYDAVGSAHYFTDVVVVNKGGTEDAQQEAENRPTEKKEVPGFPEVEE